ncbi:MAG TPA: helix-turn-helix transcriptional regulator [Acidimicrobiia bacterium]|nr:helix-turn-helix transcriptional regulator [Acidimicrobiia bacterium]
MDDFDRALGERLRAARKRRGWSLQEVERHSDSEFKSSVLGAYERGERAISVQRLHRLASLYSAPVAALIPTQSEMDGNDDPINIDLAAIDAADQSVMDAIDRFLSAIQLRRRSSDSSLAVRQADLELLASLVRSDRSTVRKVLDQLE